MKYERIQFGSKKTIHLRKEGSNNRVGSLCGYDGFYSGGMHFWGMVTSKKEPLCKKCQKLAK
jgi:hypothetical protein